MKLSNPPTYPLCDKYDIIRTYKMEWGMVANADQVEDRLTVLFDRILSLEALVSFQEELLSKGGISGLEEPLKTVEVTTSDKPPSE